MLWMNTRIFLPMGSQQRGGEFSQTVTTILSLGVLILNPCSTVGGKSNFIDREENVLSLRGG
jgi:hypothetical protein